MRKCLILLMLSASVVSAEEASSLRWTVSGGGMGMFRTDLDGGGEFSFWRAEAGVGVTLDVAENLRLSLDFGGEHSVYDFGGASTLVGGDAEPWEDLESASVGLRLEGSIDAHWGWVVGGTFRMAWEPGADVGNALLGSGYGGVRYRFDENFALTVGAGVASRLEDDARVFPLLGLEWKLNEVVRVETRGLGLAVIAQVHDNWELVAKGGYESREWRLSEVRALLADGVARDERVMVGGEVVWKPAEGVRVSIEGGLAVWQELEALTQNGVTVGEQEGDPGAFLGGRVIFNF